MKFAYAARDREVAFIIRLLTIFGVVEQRQMRLLFNHLSNRSYGQILARLRREGLAYFSPDGQFLATSRYSLDHGKTLESVMVCSASTTRLKRFRELSGRPSKCVQ